MDIEMKKCSNFRIPAYSNSSPRTNTVAAALPDIRMMPLFPPGGLSSQAGRMTHLSNHGLIRPNGQGPGEQSYNTGWAMNPLISFMAVHLDPIDQGLSAYRGSWLPWERSWRHYRSSYSITPSWKISSRRPVTKQRCHREQLLMKRVCVLLY